MKRKTKKRIKMITISLGLLIGLPLVFGTIFMNVSPQFGGEPSEEDKARYKKSGHYREGKFFNLTTTNMEMGFMKLMSILGDYIKGIPNQKPKSLLPVQKVSQADLQQKPDSVARFTWFGHSAFLVELNGLNLLLDPMLGETPSPISIMGTKRFTKGLPLSIEELPTIDAVLISHDHYDHLDYGSIVKLKGKVAQFFVPLGVGAHLRAWGVEASRIHEMNWWDETEFEGLTFACTPSRHFSGRGLTDRFATLWCSWVIRSEVQNIYFSGDGGYADHFKAIGEKYGPFDFAMMECGQYDQRWNEIHMMPEETIQASLDIKANLVMPIHWGAFVLALHSWTDPIERATAKAREVGLPLVTPAIGQQFEIPSGNQPQTSWWESL